MLLPFPLKKNPTPIHLLDVIIYQTTMKQSFLQLFTLSDHSVTIFC